MKLTPIYSGPANHYGGIVLREDDDGSLFWGIKSYSTAIAWRPCPPEVFASLAAFQDQRIFVHELFGCVERHAADCWWDAGEEPPVAPEWSVDS